MLMHVRNMISPGDACELVASKFDTRKAAQSFLLTYASSGDIYVHALNTFEHDGKEASRKRIPRETFRRQRAKIAPSFWRSAEWTYGKTVFTGIQFDKEEVIAAVRTHANGFARDPARDPVPGSGRSAGKHGEPIATLALRYSGKSSIEIARTTAVSLCNELADEYRRIGGAVPSQTNLEAICGGILKAIRRKQFELENPQKS